ncbi:MAG: hypothetical protein HYY06_11020 [Deltaproteobacteria bacterium]|nr:hypothetical protein [Deltaproteobacteria bacterium]
MRLDLHGYYRVRFLELHNILEDGEDTGLFSDVDSARFFVQRLRLEPALTYGPNPQSPIGALRIQVDALDDVVFGDNSGLASVPLFAGDPSTVDRRSSDVPSILLKRAWLEVMLPLGLLRVGRMPSQWGMGLLTSDGNGFDDDFGDNVRGSTFDRILFATRPVAIGRVLTGREPGSFPLLLAVAYDLLVEIPLDDDSHRSPYGNWLAEGADDVRQWTFVAFYNDTAPNPLRVSDEIKAGVYFVNRKQPSTESNAFIGDAYVRLRWGMFFAEAEGLHIWGSTRAIPFPPPDPGELADQKDADIWGGVARAGVETPLFGVRLEAGYASGDAVREDEDFTGRPLHPDFNVGLLLYEEVLAEKTAQTWGTGARGFWSLGGVYDSYYLSLTGKVRPLPGLELIALALLAMPDQVDTVIESDDPLGVETDLAAKIDFARYFRFALEAGLLFPMDGLGTVGTGLPWTVQSRLAMAF